MRRETALKLNDFMAKWEETPDRNRQAFLRLKEYLDGKEGLALEFIPRSGVSYSLRAFHDAQGKKALCVVVDVIEDDPRWLSVCFFADMITDPLEKGEMIPNGLIGEDAVCFDIEKWEENYMRYIETRLDEACRSARKCTTNHDEDGNFTAC